MRSRTWSAAAVFGLFILLAAFYTRPLLEERAIKITSDPGDPILNASVLWWNATTLPFSRTWWNPPIFHPNEGVSALTENLVGVSLFATPLFWATGSPVAAYNLALFLTWPLSAYGAYLLVRYLTRRQDGALVAGVVFGFAPYRAAQLAHIQVLSSYWLPLALIGLHGFHRDGRRRWLLLFGGAWLLQSLANGYFMLMGGVLIALWIVYFSLSRARIRETLAIVGTWAIATLPLVPVLLKYKAVHDFYGLIRAPNEIAAFGAQPWAWTQVSNLTWFWPHVLGDRGTETDLFPGLTAVALVACATVAFVRALGRAEVNDSRTVGRLRWVLAGIAVFAALAAAITVAVGAWRIDVLGIRISMGGPERAAMLSLSLAVILLLMSQRVSSALANRPAGAYYASATLVAALFACGPRVVYGSTVWFDPAPYRWLLVFPGFSELRVPARFWMVGTLALGVSAGLAFVRLVPRQFRFRWAVSVALVATVLVEVWMKALPMAPMVESWPVVERPEDRAAIVELPLGPDYDAAATYRAMVHRRPVVNGVSGYDPPAYGILQIGLSARDPAMLLAIASFGPIDAVVDGEHDPDGRIGHYVMSVPGVQLLSSDGRRTAYRLPTASVTGSAGTLWPIERAEASGNRSRAPLAIDGTSATQWIDGPQQPGEWFLVDLGTPRDVTTVEQSIGPDAMGFPRRLGIDISLDGESWREVWQGDGAAAAFLGAVEQPKDIVLRFSFDAQSARFVRLRQIGRFEGGWTIAEIRVRGPAGPRYP